MADIILVQLKLLEKYMAWYKTRKNLTVSVLR